MAKVIRRNIKSKNVRIIEILDFETVITGLNSKFELTVRERENPSNESARFYASFQGGNIIMGSSYHGKSGDGKTPDEAIKEYCEQIAGKTLVFGYNDNKTEFEIPINLVHTQKIEE
jgi:hypothetical protein